MTPLPEEGGNCPKCQYPMVQGARSYPVFLQTLFGVSFLGFLLAFDAIKLHKPIVWAWCLLQVVLGIQLIRARKKAQGRVYRCIRCDSALR
jgi:hypothetical protein